ncbi:MAG: MFS transporter [Proteobacteria bacterium]|nr:MFS transporter [Pseudomonadota bacterium]MBU1965183.1 MFS transporter [Pseudomonadota bacterium]
MRFAISRRWMIFFAACLLFVLSQFYRASIAVIAPDLISDLGLDTRGLSLISASFFYTFAIMQIPISMYLDAIGPRIAMTALSLLGVAGALVFACGESIGALVAGRLLLGAGMACNLMGTLKLITLWFGPLRFATMSALALSFGTMGNMTAATPLVWMVQSMGWRITFIVFAGINLLLTILFFVVVRDRPKEPVCGEIPAAVSTDLKNILENLRDLIREKDYWIISFGTFCRYGIFAAMQTLWAGPYLMTAIGVSPVATGNMLLLMGVGMIIGSPVCGWFSDSLFKTRKGVVIAGLVGMILVLAVLACLPPGTNLTVLSVLFFGFGFFTSSGQVMYAHIKERVPVERAGAAMTGVNFFTMVGVAAFLQGLGGLMQSLYPGESFGAPAFRVAFFFCTACLVLTLALYGFTVETRGKNKTLPEPK